LNGSSSALQPTRGEPERGSGRRDGAGVSGAGRRTAAGHVGVGAALAVDGTDARDERQRWRRLGRAAADDAVAAGHRRLPLRGQQRVRPRRTHPLLERQG